MLLVGKNVALTGGALHGRGYASLTERPRSGKKGPTAIVMMNMGGPVDLDEVHPFLSALFHDRDLIPLPFQRLLAPWIAKRRTPQIKEQYAAIGGGSPILKWSRLQGEEMCKLLEELAPEGGPYKPYIMFRYAQPLTEVTLEEMRRDGVSRAIAFTQYPQYSCSTTGSSLNELFRKETDRAKRGNVADSVEWSVIDRWGTHPGLVDAIAQNTLAALRTLPPSASFAAPDSLDRPVILFSAHSLPMSVVNRGDPYVAEVAMTVGAVMDRLQKLGEEEGKGLGAGGWPYRLAWQSQVGPSAWMGQQTSDAIKGLARLGKKNVVVVPVAFTSDHIETLYELDLEYGKEAKELGMNYARAESLNGSPVFIRALADIAKDHVRNVDQNGPVSTQLSLRCPGCTNDVCGEQKKWLGKGGAATKQ